MEDSANRQNESNEMKMKAFLMVLYPKSPGRLIIIQKLSSNERKSLASRSCFTEKHIISKQIKPILKTPSVKYDDKHTNTQPEIWLSSPAGESNKYRNSVSFFPNRKPRNQPNESCYGAEFLQDVEGTIALQPYVSK